MASQVELCSMTNLKVWHKVRNKTGNWPDLLNQSGHVAEMRNVLLFHSDHLGRIQRGPFHLQFDGPEPMGIIILSIDAVLMYLEGEVEAHSSHCPIKAFQFLL
jgi:hypothetical protein